MMIKKEYVNPGPNNHFIGTSGLDRITQGGDGPLEYIYNYVDANSFQMVDIVTSNGDDGQDVLTNIEELQFSSGNNNIYTIVMGTNGDDSLIGDAVLSNLMLGFFRQRHSRW